MPVGRMLLKSISESSKMPKLKTDGARLLYTWLLSHLDCNGRFSGDPLVINGKIFTRLNKSTKEVEEYLKDLERIGSIKRYRINGDIFLWVPDFEDKQPSLRKEREAATSYPAPPELLRSNSGPDPAQIKLNQIKLNKDKLKKIKGNPKFANANPETGPGNPDLGNFAKNLKNIGKRIKE